MKTKILLICLLSFTSQVFAKDIYDYFGTSTISRGKNDEAFCEGKYFIAHVNHLNNKSEGIEFTKMFNRNPSVAQYGGYHQYYQTQKNYVLILKDNMPVAYFKGHSITLHCQDLNNDKNPEIIAEIWARGDVFFNYIFSPEFKVMYDKDQDSILWTDSGFRTLFTDLDNDGIIEINGKHKQGWWVIIDELEMPFGTTCSACVRAPRKIMCLVGEKYQDCTGRYKNVLNNYLNYAFAAMDIKLQDYPRSYVSLYNYVIDMIGLAIKLGPHKEDEVYQYVKNNFDEKSFNWFYKDLTKLGITRLEIIKNGIKQHFE